MDVVCLEFWMLMKKKMKTEKKMVSCCQKMWIVKTFLWISLFFCTYPSKLNYFYKLVTVVLYVWKKHKERYFQSNYYVSVVRKDKSLSESTHFFNEGRMEVVEKHALGGMENAFCNNVLRRIADLFAGRLTIDHFG